MTQLSSTASTCAAQWKMWLIKVFSVIYFTAVCATQGDEDVTAVYSSITPNTVLPVVITTAYVPPIPTLELQSTWLDVFPSEKVKFSCSITGSSDWTFTWFRNGAKVQSDPNVSLSAEGSILTITAAKIHSGSYSCKGHHKTKSVFSAVSNSHELKVSANKPKPIVSQNPNHDKMFPGESVTFTCGNVLSIGWEYLWYHNEREIQVSGSNHTIVSVDHPNSGQYYCKAKRGKDPFYTEDSEKTTLKVSDPPKPSLKLLSPWTDVFENETVEFLCEVDSHDWEPTWYHNQMQLQEDSVVTLDPEGLSLNITSITQAYQGDYACKANLHSRNVRSGFSDKINIKVYENIPKPTLSKVPGFNEMFAGETVKFTCNVDVSTGWNYRWYKDGKDLTETNKTISIRLGLSDGGKYFCMATRGEVTSTDISDEIPQVVHEIPAPDVTQETPWLDVFPHEIVKFSCKIKGGLHWIYTWYKDGQELVDNVSFDSNRATLSIISASTVHAGQYTCMGRVKDRSVNSRSSSGLTLTVYEKQPSVILVQDPDYQVMFPGESVTFSCHINVSTGWKYLWYKDGSHFGNPSEESRNNYMVSSTNQGSYKCQAIRGSFTVSSQDILLQVEKNKPKPSITQQPNVDKVYTGESVSFECKVKLSYGWEYLWTKNGENLSISSSSFNISDANSSDSGTYKCMATRSKTMYVTELSDGQNLHVSEIPIPTLKQATKWLDVFPSESVKLSCEMDGTSDWTYTWYKDGQIVLPENTVSFDSDKTTLSIPSASVLHRGQYVCSGIFKSRSVKSSFSSGLILSVYDEKPRVILGQNPNHSVMYTEDSVSFSCHINVSSGWEYLWYKDGSLLPESGNKHTIPSVLTTHTGSYKCKTKRGVFQSDPSQTISLHVEKRPKADIILLTGWSEVFATDSLVLKCGVVENQNEKERIWNYTWFKNNIAIDRPTSAKHTVTPQDDPEQSLYTCKGNRSGRPSYSKMSDQFTTKNLLLKRRVLLSISGFIFFGIIAVFLGCIILRVIRKPAKDEYKPEEVDLFLNMSQLKGRDDAPCPLVEYITDAALNAPSKEEDENGVICSETTPLPITSQDDQAVTTESQDATENNGGLVSFKQ
ncbi:hemicentin-1-like [Morone saxatilis]|uniref:hemicentin-1-like n=1 Tax=Morone saxatilis TaxID=34816 RepID=UPI0015E21D6E|nr:hemicentin-1-like [Morone saxatilis]